MKKSDRMFSKLLTETEAVFGVPRKDIPVSRGPKKRWRDLVQFWGEHSDDVDGLVFYSALYHIACGETPMGPRLDTLGVLVKEVILNVPEAVEAWRTTDTFKESYTCVIDDIKYNCRENTALREFICNRLLVRTFYRSEVELPQNIALVDRRQLAHAQKVARIRHTYFQFMDAVKVIIPSAKLWKADYFANPACICAALTQCHGQDCAYWEYILDKLIWMVQRKLNGQSYYGFLFDPDMYIPDSLAELIWPNEMEKDICWQFSLLSRRQPSDPKHLRPLPAWDDPQSIVKTWAYKKICDWRKSQSYPISNKVRSAILQYAMGIHPATTKSMPT